MKKVSFLILWFLVLCSVALGAYSTTTQHPKVYPYTSIMASPYSCDPTGTIDCAAAIEQIKANQSNVGKLFVPNGTFLINTNLTIPAGMTLDFAAGGKLSISAGKTLTILGQIRDDGQEIFAGSGTVVLTNVKKVNLSWFATLALADAAASASSKEFVIDKDISVSADITLSSNIRVLSGNIFSIATGKTLTINGPFEAGQYQVFSCSGTGKVVFGAGTVKEVLPEWWGAVHDGTTDCSAAFQAAITTGVPVHISGTETTTYKITTPLVAVDNMVLYSPGRAKLKAATAGKHILSGVSLTNVKIENVVFEGINSSTTPTENINSEGVTLTGLVTLDTCTDVTVTGCEFSTFYNTFVALHNTRLKFTNNYCHNWLLYGVLASMSSYSVIDDNHIKDCDQAGGVNAYGVMLTGDSTNTDPAVGNSISFNRIANIPSWDGIMSHDCSGLRIIGNDIRNVRLGIDISLGVDTGAVEDVQIIGNYVESATTDPWATAAANHLGIQFVGRAAKNATGGIIANNIVSGFFGVSGLTTSGSPADITIENADDVIVEGNICKDHGSEQGTPGIWLNGNLSSIRVGGNTLKGSMTSGGIRIYNVTGSDFYIGGNIIVQTDATKSGIEINGSTITRLSIGENSSNSNASLEYVVSTSTLSYKGMGMFYSYSTTWDPASLANNTSSPPALFDVPGTKVGDFVEATFSLNLEGLTLTTYAKDTAVVAVVLNNNTGAPVDLGSGTLRIRVKPGN